MSIDFNCKRFDRKFIVEAISPSNQQFSKAFKSFEEALSQIDYWISIGCEVHLYNYVFSMRP